MDASFYLGFLSFLSPSRTFFFLLVSHRAASESYYSYSYYSYSTRIYFMTPLYSACIAGFSAFLILQV